jgi:hypothetical protein
MLHVLLPDQYLGEAGERVAEPQKRLMLAVLQTVVDDCTGSAYRRSTGQLGPVDSRTQQEAAEYVASDDRSWPFSFRNICDAIGLDAEYLRNGIFSAMRRTNAAVSTAKSSLDAA